jgi:outer membrane protein OmpA-like peptidoglycan-associated protein
MNKIITLLLLTVSLGGCAGSKNNIIMVSPDSGGRYGAMEVRNNAGAFPLGEGDKSVVVRDRSSLPAPVSLSAAETDELFRDALAVQPLVPASYVLYFDFDSNELTSASRELLPEIVRTIKQRDSRDIIVVGHTDLVGEAAYNQVLGMKRSQVVRELLVGQGVEASVIKALSHGSGNPLVPTAPGVAEPRNRRVEVVVR